MVRLDGRRPRTGRASRLQSGNGPDCVGNVCDDVRPDNEKILGGSGNDVLRGDLSTRPSSATPATTSSAATAASTASRAERAPTGRDEDHASKLDPPGKGDTSIMGDGDDYVGGTGGDEHIELGEGDDRGAMSNTAIGAVYLDMGPGNDVFDSAVALERLLDEHALDLLERQVLEPRPSRRAGRGAPDRPARTRVPCGQQHRALDRVLELAHVAGPGVREQRCHAPRARSRRARFR